MTKPLLVALVAVAPLVLSACAGTKQPESDNRSKVRVVATAPPLPKIVGEQALLDPSSVTLDPYGHGKNFLALDGKVPARVTYDCKTRHGRLYEKGLMTPFMLNDYFPSRFTKAALEACGELPMPEPLTADQKALINAPPTEADKERANREWTCGNFAHMPYGQKMALIQDAQTNPRLREIIGPCIHAPGYW